MKESVESRLGMFFALAVIAALVVLESLGTFAFFQRGYHLHATFKNVQELKVGDSVKMGGVPIGRVEEVHLTTNGYAAITMNLDRKAAVHTDSIAVIRFTGLMGQNYVDVSFGAGTVQAEDGATLQSVEQPDLSALMGRLDSVAANVENLTKSFSGEQIDKLLGPLTEFVKNNQSNLTATIANFKTVSDRVADGQGTVGKLLKEDELYKTALTTVSNLQSAAANFESTASQAHAVLLEADGIVKDVKAGKGTVGKLLTDDAVFVQAASTMTNLNQITTKMNKGEGTVGKLINDDSTLNNVKLSLQKLDKATESLEDTGPLSILGTMVNSLF